MCFFRFLFFLSQLFDIWHSIFDSDSNVIALKSHGWTLVSMKYLHTHTHTHTHLKGCISDSRPKHNHSSDVSSRSTSCPPHKQVVKKTCLYAAKQWFNHNKQWFNQSQTRGGCCGVFHPVRTIMNAAQSRPLSVIGWINVYYGLVWLNISDACNHLCFGLKNHWYNL